MEASLKSSKVDGTPDGYPKWVRHGQRHVPSQPPHALPPQRLPSPRVAEASRRVSARGSRAARELRQAGARRVTGKESTSCAHNVTTTRASYEPRSVAMRAL